MKKLIVLGLVIAMAAMGAAANAWVFGISGTSGGDTIITDQFDGQVAMFDGPGNQGFVTPSVNGKSFVQLGDTTFGCPFSVDIAVFSNTPGEVMNVSFTMFDPTGWNCSPCTVYGPGGEVVAAEFDMMVGTSFQVEAPATAAAIATDGTIDGAYNTYTLVCGVPEPGSMVALGTGLVGLVGFGIRRRK